jgi:dipeptidase D
MNNISKLNPEIIWKHFYSLTQIPRQSKSETQIRAFLADFGKGLGLETIVDEIGNVIIRKPATPGMENRMGIVLQGHMDMVPQKNSDKKHDFTTDPIETYIDGEWVTANGTTLGADNGMGVAAAMAILESKDLQHGPIEMLVTTDEETGMTGANSLKPGVLKGDILMNLDSEDEGELYVGCAGGVDANIFFDFEHEEVPEGSVAYELLVSGLKGGHSGMDIVLGRGNANKLLFRFMKEAETNFDMRLASVAGGGLRNAIPREAKAIVILPAGMKNAFLDSLGAWTEVFKKELAATEPGLSFVAKETAMPAVLIDEDTQWALINAVYACPNGVIRMSDSMPGLVETSTNLASVISDANQIKIQCLLRSSVDSAKEDLASMIASVFELAGAECSFTGAYPGWKPNMESAILKVMQEVYNNRFGKIPEIKAIHAGLECGILGGSYPNWDMISFGPTIRYPHSPDEKVLIASVEKFWIFLTETLKNVPVK